MNVLGLVPARGGSKGIPGKNIRLLHGRPLLAYALDSARASRVVSRVVLSTDDETIASVGQACGLEVPYLRPSVLATDDAPMAPVIEHAVAYLSTEGWTADVIVLLQPTSPLRTPAHIRQSVELLLETGADSVVSVVELPQHLSPDYVMRIENGRLVHYLPEGERVTRRQDARVACIRDGTVYTFWRRTLLDKGNIYGDNCWPMFVPAHESLTIDSPRDWIEAERRIQRNA
jgi:CMP-N,N'-diacetyllegionaminic acid synthase